VGKFRATQREVATLAGVNPATVSRVLNPETRHLVKAATAHRVEAAAQRLEYKPNGLARSLRTRQSFSIGVMLPDLTNPLFPPMVRGIEDRLATAGYTALLTNTDGDPERERLMFETLRVRQVDGFIMATADAHGTLISAAIAEGTPLVLAGRTVDLSGIFAVVPDDRRGIEQAVEHLVGLGHRAIGHIAGPQEMSTGLLRHSAFVEAMAGHGIAIDRRAVVVATGFVEEAGAVAARALLSSWPECTAIVAANDLIALGIYRTAHEFGRSCPDDLSVVGFNDMPFADKFNPPLTTIHLPLYDLGAQAAGLLLERIQSEASPARTLFLETTLVVRGSTAPPRV
jgi:LacI family transcriptional regulator, galactose operon repressor